MLQNLFSDSIIIDCRSDDQYRQSRASGSAHISSDDLFIRMHELPQRQQAFFVICDRDCIKSCQTFFADKDYQSVIFEEWNEQLCQRLQSLQRLDQSIWGKGQIMPVLATFWQPAGLIKAFVHQHSQSFSITPGNGLDIACGSGRDAVYLAKQGWQMQGLDYNAGSIQRCQDLALRHHCHISCLQVDLEATTYDETDPSQALLHLAAIEPESLDLITVFRYLHRPLFSAIRHSLKPGGVILYQTFMQGCEHISRPKNPRFLLAPGELAQTFNAEHGFEVLIDQVQHLEDGRPLSSFLARKLITGP